MRFRRSPAKDHARFEALYKQQYQPVRGYLLRALRGNVERAEDLTHETFIRMWRSYGTKVHRLREDEVQRLLITTARNCVTDMWRRDSKLIFWQAYVDTDHPLDVRPAADHLDRVLEAEFVDSFFEAAAKHLTDGEWRVAFMGWMEDQTDIEIAAALGTTVRTVRTLRCSARKKLRACASRDGYEITFSDVGGTDPSASTPGIGEVKV